MNEITIRKKEELDPQEKSYRRRKDMIKNFIIVFLVIMLILTFFSNTIMNYSLPRVAVQYIQSGTITSVIRGQGTVESGDPYNVMVKYSKTVGSISAKVGQDVKEGDLLLSLEAEDSQELKDAKKALDDATNAYNVLLLSEKVDAAIIASSQGTVDVNAFRDSITNAQGAIKAAEKNVDDCQAVVDSLNDQINIVSGTTVTEAEKTNLDTLKTASDNAEATFEAAKTTLSLAESSVATAQDTLTAAQNTKGIAKETLDAAQSAYDYLAVFKDVLDKKTAFDEDDTGTVPDLTDEEKATYESYIAVDSSILYTIDERLESANSDLIAASDAYTVAYTEEAEKIAGAQATLDTANKNLESAKKAKNDAEAAYNTAYTNWKNANDGIVSKQNNTTDTLTNLRNQLSVAQINLTNANKTLELKKTDLNELVAKIGSIRELTDAMAAITAAQENVDKYQEQSGAAEVYAPVNGTILSINVSSGKKTSTDDPVVVIQPEGQSFTMSFSLENDKAKEISIGDPAEVTNSWWYNDVTGTVATIRPDQSDPNRKKLITLNLDGSLTAGQSLTMTISSRTSNYDLVVPSSAVHNDTKGDYILVCESKSSPLGNRYFANRYDVEVLATDDTQTAISAGLMGYEYVITSASKPISAGSQVRLSEN